MSREEIIQAINQTVEEVKKKRYEYDNVVGRYEHLNYEDKEKARKQQSKKMKQWHKKKKLGL